MKARVDAEACTGCGMCVETCPEVFKMEGDVAVAHTNPVPAEAEEKCRQASKECPVDAIPLEE